VAGLQVNIHFIKAGRFGCGFGLGTLAGRAGCDEIKSAMQVTEALQILSRSHMMARPGRWGAINLQI